MKALDRQRIREFEPAWPPGMVPIGNIEEKFRSKSPPPTSGATDRPPPSGFSLGNDSDGQTETMMGFPEGSSTFPITGQEGLAGSRDHRGEGTRQLTSASREEADSPAGQGARRPPVGRLFPEGFPLRALHADATESLAGSSPASLGRGGGQSWREGPLPPREQGGPTARFASGRRPAPRMGPGPNIAPRGPEAMASVSARDPFRQPVEDHGMRATRSVEEHWPGRMFRPLDDERRKQSSLPRPGRISAGQGARLERRDPFKRRRTLLAMDFRALGSPMLGPPRLGPRVVGSRIPGFQDNAPACPRRGPGEAPEAAGLDAGLE